MPNEETVLRALHPKYIKSDGTINHTFLQDPTGLSVNLATFASEQETLATRPGFRLVRFTVRDCRSVETKPPSESLNVKHDPKKRDREKGLPRNYAHALVVKSSDSGVGNRKISTAQARELAKVVILRD